MGSLFCPGDVCLKLLLVSHGMQLLCFYEVRVLLVMGASENGSALTGVYTCSTHRRNSASECRFAKFEIFMDSWPSFLGCNGI